MDFHKIEMEGIFYIEEVSTLPAWTSNDEKRIIYVADEDILYYGNSTEWIAITSAQESGDKMWYYQNTCPTGWTIDATAADALLAVKGGSQAYNASGGTQGGTWTWPSHTLTIAQIPSHNHLVTNYAGISDLYPRINSSVTSGQSGHGSGYTGGGGSHSHGGTTFRPKANVGIICTKD